MKKLIMVMSIVLTTIAVFTTISVTAASTQIDESVFAHISDKEVTSIDESDFSFDTNICYTDIYIENNLSNISKYGLLYDTNESGVSIKSGYAPISDKANVCKEEIERIYKNSNEIDTISQQLAYFNSKSAKTYLSIPVTIDGVYVKSIESEAFSKYNKLTDVIIPPNVKNIGSSNFESIENITIHGYSGTYAEKYARKYNINFSTITPPADIDSDRHLTAADALLILRQGVGLETFNQTQTDRADINRDGVITAHDALITLRLSVGLEKLEDYI